MSLKKCCNILTFLFIATLFITCFKEKPADMKSMKTTKNTPVLNGIDSLKIVADQKVRQYIWPKKVIWTSENTNKAKLENPDYLINTTEQQVTLEQVNCCILTNNGSSPGILLDFGKELQGGIQLLVGRMKKQTPATFRIRFGESASEAMSDIGQEKNATNDHAVRDMTVQAPWMGTVEIGNTGFRFVRIDLLDKNRSVPLIGVRAIFSYRDIEYKGSFQCNDERLNKIWETGAYTVHLCMQDYLWDGIKRDRLVWIGDMHPETMTILSVFGAHNIVPKSLDLVKHKTPLPKWMNGISSYSMWWLLIHHDWYMYSGDITYLKENREYISNLLTHLTTFIDENGKEKLNGFRFLDWPTRAEPAAVHAGLQALMTMTFKAGATIASVLDQSELEVKCENAVKKLEQYTPVPGNSKQAAALLALSGIDDAQSLNQQVMSQNGVKGLSTFYGYYVLQARALAGDYQGCLDDIRTYWGGMLDMGATTFWEDFDLDWTKNALPLDELPKAGKNDIHGDFGNYCYKGFRHSLCHGWASGPTAWLSQHVLGVKPVEPGFKAVKIEPHLGDLEWAEGSFPTPFGEIHVRHTKKADGSVKSEIETPKGVRIVK